MVAIRRENMPLTSLDPEAIGSHDAGNTLVIDEVGSSLRLVRYASISIAGQFVLDVLDDRSELGFAEIQSPCRGSIVKRASLEVDHFASPA